MNDRKILSENCRFQPVLVSLPAIAMVIAQMLRESREREKKTGSERMIL